MKSLCQVQQDAIDAYLALRETTCKSFTIGNRLPRSVAKVRKQYEAQAAKLGMSEESVKATWRDVLDMVALEFCCRHFRDRLDA